MNEFDSAIEYIHSLGIYSNPRREDLGKIEYLCKLFGNPQEQFKSIHIAGTNGKGSTAVMLSNIIQELGHKSGRYMSPHVESFNERISIDGENAGSDLIAEFVGKIKETFELNRISREFMPNQFEFITLLGFLIYRHKMCDIAVVETGLGGRLDPTNIIKSPLASVITSVSIDHTEILGDTIEQITREKCGIIKEHSPVVLYPLNPANVIDIVRRSAEQKRCELVIPRIDYLRIIHENLNFTEFEYKHKLYKIKLAGRHYVYNAVTVIETIDCLYKNTVDSDSLYKAVYTGIERAYLPGRFQIISGLDSDSPIVIIDGAHNISGANALKESIKTLLPGKKITLICGILKDKKPEEILRNILDSDSDITNIIEKFIAVPIDSPRSESPEKLCEYARKIRPGINAEHCYNLYDLFHSLNKSKDGIFVCFGSLYLAGTINKIMRYF